MASKRFVIDDIVGENSDPAESRKRAVAAIASHSARWLSWLELAILMPPRLLAAVGWLAIPLLVFAIVPVVLLGTLLLVQAPIFFLLWKLFGDVASSDESPIDARDA